MKKEKESDSSEGNSSQEEKGEEMSKEERELLKQKQLEKILSNKILVYILQKLRQGPIQTTSLHKLVGSKFSSYFKKHRRKKPKNLMKILIKYDYVRKFSYTKEEPNPDRHPKQFPQIPVGKEKEFYLLVKDFYAIRKPPINILGRLNESDYSFDAKTLKGFKKEIETFFNGYTSSQTSGDDPRVIQIFINTPLYLVVSLLADEIIPLKKLEKIIKDKYNLQPNDIMKVLKKMDFIKLLPSSKNEEIVVLKTAIEVDSLFPEYLIRYINQTMAEKKMDKNFAILTLNMLKKYYLRLEKPDLLEEYKNEIESVRNLFYSYIGIELEEKQGDYANIGAALTQVEENKNKDKVKRKKVRKTYEELRELYSKIGAVQKIVEMDKLWEKYNE